MATEQRLIDVQDAIKLLRGKCVAKYPNTFMMGLFAAADEIAQLPTVDDAPVVHGRWYWKPSGEKQWTLTCSVCESQDGTSESYNYCPTCGAKMDGDGDG